MHKLEYLRRDVRVGDYNNLVEAVNWLIDKVQEKKELEEITIEKRVKDYKFFNDVEVQLPYTAKHTILNHTDAMNVFSQYTLTYKEMNNIKSLLDGGKIISLTIVVEEEVTEKEKKQEIIFETVESVDLKEGIKVKGKKGRKRKTRN